MSSRLRGTQSDIARILGVNPGTISNNKHRPDFPPVDKNNQYDIKDVVIWWHVNKDGGCKAVEPDYDAALFEGSNSPHLERLRAIKADREELKLAQDRAELMSVDDFRQGYLQAHMPYRNCADAFRRQGMDEAFRMLQEACDEVADNLADGFEIDSRD